MVPDNSIKALLFKLTTSLDSANAALPDSKTILPPADGISLFDVKSELLLSYLQNLAFLILAKLRNHTGPSSEEVDSINDDVVKTLVELRVYLEKGVRPLEGKLKYQIDKVLRAADSATRDALNQKATDHPKKGGKSRKVAIPTGSEDDKLDEDEDDSNTSSASEIDELSYRPNPAAFARPGANSRAAATKATSREKGSSNGIYKPPRITPTSLASTHVTPDNARPRSSRRPERSSAIDEYIASELSGAPIAEPSIGSTIVQGGRRVKSTKEREVEADRRAYEENNFVRLAPESKKVIGGRARGRDGMGTYGGEEMRSLAGGLERIERLTRKRRAGGGEERMTTDGPRGDGVGEGYMGKRRKTGRR